MGKSDEDVEITKSSGNVWLDLELPDAQKMLRCVELLGVVNIHEALKALTALMPDKECVQVLSNFEDEDWWIYRDGSIQNESAELEPDGAFFSAVLDQHDWSQARLAALLSVTQPKVSHWIADKYPPKEQSMRLLYYAIVEGA